MDLHHWHCTSILGFINMSDTVSKSVRSRIMAAVKANDTAPEMIVRRMVHAMGNRYRLHVRDLPGTPDMVFPRLRKVIFIHGCFWHLHKCPRSRIPASNRCYWIAKLQRNSQRDKLVRRTLRRDGWRALVVWECQTAPNRLNRLRNRLARFLEK